MKSHIIILIIFIFSSCKQNKNTNKRTGEYMPNLQIQLLEGAKKYSTGMLKIGTPTLLLFFLTDCPHCQKETEMIIKSIVPLKDIQLCFISFSPPNSVRNFCRYYKLDGFTNIVIGTDSSQSSINYYGIHGVPYMALYDRKKQFKAEFSGEISASTIIESLQD